MRGAVRQSAIVAATLVNLVLNGLAGAGLLFGVQTGAVSDAAPTPITPAGWAFSVWSVIFVGTAVFAVWQALPGQRGPRYDALGVPAVAANLLNGLWQIPWLTGRFGIAAAVIVGILASLIVLYVRLDRMAPRGGERWALAVPTALWMAWLSVATPLNLTIWFRDLGWTSDALVWPVVAVALVAAVAGWLLVRTADLAAALVWLWAFAAIAAGAQGTLLAVVAGAMVTVVAALLSGRLEHSLWPTTA